MMNKPPLINAYLFIKKNRFRKKSKIYRQAIGMMIDPVIAFYLLLFGGYVIASFLILVVFIIDHDDIFILVDVQAPSRFISILTILPLRYITQSFRMPGVIFSSS